MQTQKIEELQKITDTLLKQCIKNMKDIEAVINVLETLLQEPEYVAEPEPIDQLTQIDNSIESHDIIIARRVDLHKELGSYIEPQSELQFPTITPLSKLTKLEQNTLYKQIFSQATHYVKNILSIDTADVTYDTQIATEADRLLSVWCNISKSKY